MDARTKTINGKKYYFPSTGKDFTTMLKKKQLEQEQREMKQFIDADTLTPEHFAQEVEQLVGNYIVRLYSYQILGILETIKAKMMYETGKRLDDVHARNLCDSRHPETNTIRCTKKAGHTGLCGTGGSDDDEIMWDV
jgi:hypothetical protein